MPNRRWAIALGAALTAAVGPVVCIQLLGIDWRALIEHPPAEKPAMHDEHLTALTQWGLVLRETAGPDGVRLLVHSVSGPARLAGVQPGDVLRRVNGRTVASAADVMERLGGPPAIAAILVQRRDDEVFIPLRAD
ncbi:PDZ domain-containing protein [Chitinivorax sp. PXF-14]|uniref:PDZ domain-containing protein n=1 Tax=Chitinivorax sp. PXF-14 TaxID=3230488 RepID=UPI0034671964